MNWPTKGNIRKEEKGIYEKEVANVFAARENEMPRSPRTDFRSNFRAISVHSIRIEGKRGPNSWLDIYQNNKDFLLTSRTT
uniref:Uncharacterized protein n=1 Tax=Bursaphelenchus xylophilus TaxID=6326 RepID=A0A1I7SS64_BURXY